MLFRVLLNILKPSNEQLRGETTGKIKMYHFLLRQLLKTYLHYAMSDIITIDNGNVKIVHEFRDLEFEDELIRNKIKFKSDLLDKPLAKLEKELGNMINDANKIKEYSDKIIDSASTLINKTLKDIENKVNGFKIDRLTKKISKLED